MSFGLFLSKLVNEPRLFRIIVDPQGHGMPNAAGACENGLDTDLQRTAARCSIQCSLSRPLVLRLQPSGSPRSMALPLHLTRRLPAAVASSARVCVCNSSTGSAHWGLLRGGKPCYTVRYHHPMVSVQIDELMALRCRWAYPMLSPVARPHPPSASLQTPTQTQTPPITLAHHRNH